jgi:hypothetical protein
MTLAITAPQPTRGALRAGLALAYAAASLGGGFLAVAAATNLVRRARLVP